MDKEEYFRQLYALNESSDDEEVDTNDAREVFRQSRPVLSTCFPKSPASRSSPRRSQPATNLKKAPAIHRTTSAPVTSNRVVNETPPEPVLLRRKSSLLRQDISSHQDISTTPTPPEGTTLPIDTSSNARPVPERSASTPNIGSVVMNNSKGIEAMLGKRTGEGLAKAATKKKATKTSAKKDVIKLVPEAERFFSSKTIFWIPDNDILSRRKRRIEIAREFGAVWTKEWTPEITHVVADDKFSYQAVIDFLAPTIKSKELPRHITLVNELYVVECAQFKRLLDPDQRKYHVNGSKEVAGGQGTSPSGSQNSEQSLQLKAAKPRKGDLVPEKTPSQSQPSTQIGAYNGESSSRVSFMPDHHQDIARAHASGSNTPPESNMGKRGDILDEWIDLARKMKDLPLDDEGDEDEERPSSRDDPEESGGSEEERARSRKPKRKYKKYALNKLDSFVCMHGGTGKVHEDNPNGHTIDILQQMGEYYGRIGEMWRPRAYRNAVGTLKRLKVRIACYEDAIRLPAIGHRIAKKIEEIAVTGHLRRLDHALSDPTDMTLQLFLKIYGVGLSQAHKWIQAGHKTLEDLSTLPDLHKNQRIGIEHYHDFDTRIPRDEVTALGDIVKKTAAEIDDQVEAIIGGSYRRGAETSGDIDFILTKPNTSSNSDLISFLEALVSRLTRDGFLVAPLAVPKSGGSKWHGACILPGNPIWRRIDFLIVPQTEFGAALIYFTGDDIFNRSMRLLASTKGMRLNQRGLYKDVMRTFGREKVTEGTLVEGANERDIFDCLGVPWRPPHERICH